MDELVAAVDSLRGSVSLINMEEVRVKFDDIASSLNVDDDTVTCAWDLLDQLQMSSDLRLGREVDEQLKRLKQNFVIMNILYRKYEEIFIKLFNYTPLATSLKSPGGGSRGERSAEEHLFGVGWFVYLYCKNKIYNDIPDLLQSLYLILCSLNYIYIKSSPSTRKLPIDQIQDDSTSTTPGILQYLGKSMGIQIEDLRSTEFKTFLPIIQANFNSLNKLYEHQYYTNGDIDERIFLFDKEIVGTPFKPSTKKPSSAESTPKRSTIYSTPVKNTNQYDPSKLPQTPISVSLSMIAWVKKTVDDAQPSEALLGILKENSTDIESIENRVTLLTAPINNLYTNDAADADNAADISNKRKNYAVKLYYSMLEKILGFERTRSVGNAQLVNLVRHEEFHRSLLTTSFEIVAYAYKLDHLLFPHFVTMFNVHPFSYIRIIENFMKVEEALPQLLCSHFALIEERIIEEYAWGESSPIFGLMEHYKDVLKTPNVPAKSTSVLMSPAGGQGSANFSQSFSTPTKPTPMQRLQQQAAPSPIKEPTKPAVPTALSSQILKATIATVIEQSGLLRSRNLDVIIICTTYAICKANNHHVTFKAIIEARNLSQRAYREIVMDGGRGDIVLFYNTVYLPLMDGIIHQIRAKHKLVVAANTTTTGVHLSTPTKSSSITVASPMAGPSSSVNNNNNVTVTPMVSVHADTPSKLSYSIGRTPSKELKNNNNSISTPSTPNQANSVSPIVGPQDHNDIGGSSKSRGKRLFFEEPSSSSSSSSSSSTTSPTTSPTGASSKTMLTLESWLTGKNRVQAIDTNSLDGFDGGWYDPGVPNAKTIVEINKLLDYNWVLRSSYLVILMQAGFSLLEAGMVRAKNTKNILVKNLITTALGALFFFGFGYSFSFDSGPNYSNSLFACCSFFTLREEDYYVWISKWAFSSIACTIINGSVSERTKIVAYLVLNSIVPIKPTGPKDNSITTTGGHHVPVTKAIAPNEPNHKDGGGHGELPVVANFDAGLDGGAPLSGVAVVVTPDNNEGGGQQKEDPIIVIDNSNPFDRTKEVYAAHKELNIERQTAVRGAMKHAWDSYVAKAWGYDELKPLAGRGHNWFHLGLTVLDSLDTLYMMGLDKEFEVAKEFVRTLDHRKESGEGLSVFEVTIRILGGYLATYEMTKDKMFLEKAEDIGTILLQAFDDESPFPKTYLNMHRLTGNPIWEKKSDAIAVALDKLHKITPGLYPIHVSPDGKKFCGSTLSMGSMADSFYEYLLKMWMYSKNTDQRYRKMYLESTQGMLDELLIETKKGDSYLTIVYGRSKTHTQEHLACMAGGMFALGVAANITGDPVLNKRHLQVAENLTETCAKAYFMTKSGLGPEIVRFDEGDGHMQVNNGQYILRPETVESLFYLYRITGDTKYQEWGWRMFEALELHCRTPSGYVGLDDVNNPAQRNDYQQSFFMAETLKYFYLLFSESTLIPLDQFVFNTEAHPIPIPK
eukprot:gene15435-18304_t